LCQHPGGVLGLGPGALDVKAPAAEAFVDQ
jgi:hypothetical protein